MHVLQTSCNGGGGGGGTVECDMLQGRGVNACDNLPKESQ